MKIGLGVAALVVLSSCAADDTAETTGDRAVLGESSAPPMRGLLKCALRSRSLERPTDAAMDLGQRVFIDLDTVGYTKLSEPYSGDDPDPNRYSIRWQEENSAPRVWQIGDLQQIGVYGGGDRLQRMQYSTRFDGRIFCFSMAMIDRAPSEYTAPESRWMQNSRPFGELRNACMSGIDLTTREFFRVNASYVDEGVCQEY